MSDLLVLCGDDRKVNDQPFITLHHPSGKLIAEKTIEGIYPEEFERILYVITKEAEESSRVGTQIYDALGSRFPVEIIMLRKKTSGPAETAYQAIKTADISGEVAIKDSHNYIQLLKKCRGNFVAGLDLTRYEHTVDDLRSKSFMILNEQRQVLDIVEKRFRSDVISCGLYGFKCADEFIWAYERLKDPNYSIEKLYISHIISYLVGYSNKFFYAADVLGFEDWKTPHAWACVQRRYGLYFLDLDKMGIHSIPINGVLLEMLRNISQKGGKFIAYKRNSEIDAEELAEYLKGNGVLVLSVITGCGYSETRRIIDEWETIEEITTEDI